MEHAPLEPRPAECLCRLASRDVGEAGQDSRRFVSQVFWAWCWAQGDSGRRMAQAPPHQATRFRTAERSSLPSSLSPSPSPSLVLASWS